MSEFVSAAKTSDLAESEKLCVEVDDRFLVIVRIEDQYYCFDDVCTHDGGPLGEGELDGYCIACPRHGAKFDVRTGEALTMPATEATATYEIKVEGDDLLVKLD